jgi:hypothetical protein
MTDRITTAVSGRGLVPYHEWLPTAYGMVHKRLHRARGGIRMRCMSRRTDLELVKPSCQIHATIPCFVTGSGLG